MTRGGASCHWSYDQWQSALQTAFLEGNDSGQPFMFFLDHDEADRLWPQHKLSSGDLARAVSGKLNWASNTAVFDGVRTAAKHPGGPPATLPLLAVTVLAAAEMHRNDVAASNAYFLRLAQILRPELVDRAQAEPVAQQLSASFSTVATMWELFDQWVRAHEATLGQSTIEKHPHLARIGYPLSQALIRRSDRLLLTQFYEAADLTGSGVPDPSAVLNYLTIWAAQPRSLSPTFCKALSAPSQQKTLAEHVTRLAKAWDGVVLTAEGRRRLKPRLAMDLDQMRCRWLLPVINGVTSDSLDVNGRSVAIATPESGKFYTAIPALPSVTLACALRVAGSHCDGSFAMPDILTLREDPDAGGWVSCDGMTVYEEHVLVVRPDLGPAIEAALDIAAQRGWSMLRQSAARRLLPGRLVYRGVTLADGGAFESAVRELAPALIGCLRPQGLLRAQLVNGLRVASSLGGHHYLVGGEPDLRLPVGNEARRVAASLDGIPQEGGFLATGFPVELRRPGPLCPGRHELVVDHETLVFDVHERLQTFTQGQHLGWKLGGNQREPEQVPAGEEQRFVRGASVPRLAGDLEPLLVRRRDRVYLVDRRGRCVEQTPPPASELLARVHIPPSQFWECVPNASTVWLVEERQGITKPPRLLTWDTPVFGTLDRQSSDLWRDIASRHRGNDPLLDNYIGTWQR